MAAFFIPNQLSDGAYFETELRKKKKLLDFTNQSVSLNPN